MLVGSFVISKRQSILQVRGSVIKVEILKREDRAVLEDVLHFVPAGVVSKNPAE